MSSFFKNLDETPKNVLLVESDTAVIRQFRTYFQRLGVKNLIRVADGEKAWEAIGKESFDFICMEWKLAKISGLVLFNKIKSLPAYQRTPILVCSSKVEEEDFRLLEEFPCVRLQRKPLSLDVINDAYQALKAEHKWIESNSAIIKTLMDAAGSDLVRAERLLDFAIEKSPNPLPMAVLVGKKMADDGQLVSAARVFHRILLRNQDSIIAMNELGKVLHRQGKHGLALRILNRAQSFSSHNVSRLCFMGKVELHNQNPESARHFFRKALEIDTSSRVALSGQTLAANSGYWFPRPKADHVPHTFASLLNTLGITYVRTGQFQRGIDQYLAALDFVDNRKDTSRLSFNLGLGFLRWGNKKDAIHWLEKSQLIGGEEFTRGSELMKRILRISSQRKLMENELVSGEEDLGKLDLIEDEITLGEDSFDFDQLVNVIRRKASAHHAQLAGGSKSQDILNDGLPNAAVAA